MISYNYINLNNGVCMEKMNFNKIVKWGFAIISSPLCASLISLGSIWLYLMRLGRQDLFLDFVNLRDILGVLSIFFLLSTLSYGFIFYIQTIIITSLLALTNNESNDGKITQRHFRVMLLSSIFSVFTFYLYIFINKNTNGDINTGFYILLNCISCIAITFFLSKNTKNNNGDKKESILKRAIRTILIPSFIGFSSIFIVLPLSLMFKTINFPDGTSDLQELTTLIPLSVIIVLITLIPAGFVFSTDSKTSIVRKLVVAIGVALSLLSAVSIFIPGIPLLVLNSTLTISGVIDYRPQYFSIPVNKYPSEILSAKSWEAKKSEDSNFIIFKGATFLSLGTIKLICPPQVIVTYQNSMQSRLLNYEYDSELLNTLKKQATECLVFRKDELSQWIINPTPYPAVKTLQVK